MKKLAFIFPGQGSQSIGMGKGFYDSYGASRDVFDEAGAVLGIDIKSICFEGTEAELNKTENTQPAILTASIAALRALCQETDITKPSFVAGHSLGEYTALVSAGVLDFKDAVRIVRLRGRFMQEAVPLGAGKMSAIIGLDAEKVEALCKDASTKEEPVVAANINSPEQIVISGNTKAVERAEKLASDMGAKRVIPLPVSVPSHSPLMERAGEMLYSELAKIHFGEFRVPIVTNVKAEPLRDPVEIKELLRLQLTRPVRWVDIVKRIRKEGVSTMIEIGPGRVLTGLVKRIDKDIQTLNFSSPEDLGKIKEALG